MAIGSFSQKNTNQRPTIYTRLGHGDRVGFINSYKDAGGVKQSVTYPDVSGRVAYVSVREEVNGGKAKELREKGIDPSKVDLATLAAKDKGMIGIVRLRDDDPAQPDVVVNFDLTDSLGGKVMGILNALRLQGQLHKDPALNPVIAMSTFYREPHSKYNQTDKGKDSLNAYPADLDKKQDNYIIPVYMNADGTDVYVDKSGAGYLPMGVKQLVGTKNEFWDFSERDELIMSTAMSVLDVFAKHQAPADGEAGGDDGVDLNQAAAAAAPQA